MTRVRPAQIKYIERGIVIIIAGNIPGFVLCHSQKQAVLMPLKKCVFFWTQYNTCIRFIQLAYWYKTES